MRPGLVMMPAVLAALLAAGPAPADTGTYEIPEYRVKLAPKQSGVVEVSYFQRWKVLSGHIPWITVGTANTDFSILQDRSRRNVRRIGPVLQRGWSGVRIDLDRSYKAGETFEVEFAVMQKRLFYTDPKGYRLHFVPGWYDRAKIGRLTVELVFFADLGGVGLNPKPDTIEDRRLVWEAGGLGRGGKFGVTAYFPANLFPGKIAVASPKSRRSGSRSSGAWIAIVIIVGFLILGAILDRTKRGKYGGGGHVGYFGGGGCACACAGCACACACAGGGAAGCDRKLTHRCPACADRRLKAESSGAKTG